MPPDHAEHPRDLDLYVLGALTVERERAIEAHAATCPTCADALAAEARLELALPQLARETGTTHTHRATGLRRTRRRRLQTAVWTVFILAAAAAVVLLIHSRAIEGRPPLHFTCVDRSQSCFEELSQHGRFPEDFPDQIPRYESLATGAVTANESPSITGDAP